jgi:hypothetical protein
MQRFRRDGKDGTAGREASPWVMAVATTIQSALVFGPPLIDRATAGRR